MIKIKYLFTALLVFMSISAIIAQSKNAMEDKAYEYLNNEEYANAYELFDKLHKQYPKNIDYQLKLGIACLGYPGKSAEAIDIFKDLRSKSKTREVEFQLGRAYHINYMFDDAIAVLQPLVDALFTETQKTKKKEDINLMEQSMFIINNCINGKEMMNNKSVLKVTNLGKPINTSELEAVPVITADESMMIFTYQGKKSIGGKMDITLHSDPDGVYTTDMYLSMRDDSVWKEPVPLKALNSKANDAAIALSPDGRTLFTFMSTNENEGDIYVSHLKGGEFSAATPLNSNINSPSWEGSCSISADGKLLYFSSERPDGYGGKDIWVSELVNGDWGPAVNLGKTINTPYDDDAPFIHPDGITLFFSSKGHKSMGGYDIMFSTKQTDGKWSQPINMGLPVNTTSDDRYYVLNSRGDRGYFSSNRVVDGSMGSQDIYTVTPGMSNNENIILALHKGVIYGDEKPVEAQIDIINAINNENVGTFYSSTTSGKYFVTLKPGMKYHVKVTAEGYDPYETDIDVASLDVFMEKKKDIHMFSKEFATTNPDKVKQAQEEMAKADAEPVVTNTTVAVAEPVKEEPKQQQTVTVTEAKAEKTIEVEPAKEEPKQPETVTVTETKTEKTNDTEPVKESTQKQEVVTTAESKTTEPSKASSPCAGSAPDLSSVKGKSLNDPEVYKQLMNIAGNYCGEGVVFKVQIGAYRHPENFKYMNLKPLGNVESDSGVDGITRFTQKQFSVLKEAEAHRQKAIAKGQSDAWIVVFVKGQRYTLEDFIMVDFLSKSIN